MKRNNNWGCRWNHNGRARGAYLQSGLCLVLCLFLLLGCQSFSITESPLPTVSPTLTSDLSVEESPSPTPTRAPGLITLTIWAPDFLTPVSAESDVTVLGAQLVLFMRAHPDIQVQMLMKKAEGPGGIYNLLSTATAAAPAVLPDLVILNESDLGAAIHNGLVQPIPRNAVAEAELFPFAWDSIAVEDQVYGVPYLAQAQQTVYREGISSVSPLSWTVVLTGGYSVLFPAVPEGGLADDALLASYWGSEGAVMDETGAPTLDRGRLEELYRYFYTLREGRLLNPDIVMQIPDAETSWKLYQQGRGNLAFVPAGVYWQDPLRNSRSGWTPTRTGQPIALARCWSLALVSHDPVRQTAALELAQWLADAERSAELSSAVGLLPVRPQSLVFQSISLDGQQFLTTLLERARLPLPATVDQPVRRALQAGLDALLKDRETTPEDAATIALTVLRH